MDLYLSQDVVVIAVDILDDTAACFQIVNLQLPVHLVIQVKLIIYTDYRLQKKSIEQ